MHLSQEPDAELKKWLRRPTLLIANGMYLLAGAGTLVFGYAVYGLQWLLGFLIPAAREANLGYWPSALYEICLLALPAILFASKRPGVDRAMRLNPPNPVDMFCAVIAAAIGVPLFNNLGTLWMLLVQKLGGTLYSSGVAIPETSAQLLSSVFFIGVIPGVCEEILFRGALMGAWERRGTMYALIVTSVLFCALHGSLLGLPTELIVGVVLGYVVISSDSLYVGMAYHTTHNSVILILSYMSAQLTAGSESAAAATSDIASYISGMGWGLFLGSTALFLIMYVAALAVFSFNRIKREEPFEKVALGGDAPMGWRELVVLIAGLMTVGVMYAQDLLFVVGIIK